MALFRRKKCYECGSTFDLKRCRSCGKYYCPVHGFGGLCTKCQTGKMLSTPDVGRKAVTPSRREEISVGEEMPRRAPSETRLTETGPRRVRASIKYSQLDVDLLRENIIDDLKHYRRVASQVIGVEEGEDISCFYTTYYVRTVIRPERELLIQVTDLQTMPKKMVRVVSEAWSGEIGEEPSAGELFSYVVRFIHNELLFHCELIVRSMGAEVLQVENELPMEKVSPRILGVCPHCGTLTRGLTRCPTCRRTVPAEMGFREFMKAFLKRQLVEKQIAAREKRKEEEREQELRRVECLIRALGQM